ncbi:predicted protein [Chaetomium globosum CBS 148.51]|uniref:Uncharacterized protein n=1 Tax=Chaetomium globosum (strain ATCC 6205 / CBS 148.51 / DSM 1962 / NBRC 6347 / NRRL 1970) TaxID=306901 RepID=Q2H8Z4_CHAGB|nr:uncharacterized protein CHGG_03310 [Chaetomium globosum CBS 148.51]EAQ91375.1 predicted protein [Chaetomium globosum CBS 148.51]
MDTFNKVTHAASKAIWGEEQSHEEPVSGKLGNVAAGEPYDAGNIGEPNEAALASSGKKDTETPNEPTTATRTTGRTVPEAMPKPEPEPEAATKPRFVEAKDTPSQTTEEASTSQPANPSGPAGSTPSAIGMRDDSTKAQNDTSPPPEDLSASTARTPTTTNTNTTTTTTDTPPNIPGTAATTTSTSQPHDETRTTKEHQPQPSDPADAPRHLRSQARRPGPAPPRGNRARARRRRMCQRRRGCGHSWDCATLQYQPTAELSVVLGIAATDNGMGMGEEYVKSSGLAADGGDFDASRPGAGREADRLLEEKGVHPPATTHRGTDTSSGSHGSHGHGENGGKEKLGLKDKIKAKLHKSSSSS